MDNITLPNVGDLYIHTSTNIKVTIHEIDNKYPEVVCYRMMDGGLNWMGLTMFNTVFHKAG